MASRKGHYPRIHHREERCNQAERELSGAVADILEKHDLTEAEQLRVVNKALSDWIAGIARYSIREERHGRTDVPGGLERDDGEKAGREP